MLCGSLWLVLLKMVTVSYLETAHLQYIYGVTVAFLNCNGVILLKSHLTYFGSPMNALDHQVLLQFQL